MSNRKEEIQNLLNLKPKEVIERADNHLIVLNSLDELYKEFASDMEKEIIADYKDSETSKLILPIGPIQQYDYLVENLLNRKRKLANCWFFFMDEYCDEQGKAVSIDHPLSFKKVAFEKIVNPLKELGLNMNQIIFPDQNNIDKIADIINKAGGIDTCYGGIGIHGHLAFNEPGMGIAASMPRKVKLNDFTISINAIRSKIGGNLEAFPKEAYTLGMQQILSSKKIRLCCRSDLLDWASTILRLALFGKPGNDYPVTHIRNHSDYIIYTDKNTLQTPKVIL